ncbi:glyoxalase [Microbacterium sp. NPDC056234]|uniref:glyoxalase n=1 Tax=Microbacterium sp. NPDC056234 TaxID=3345757 RepID=UPI0035D7117C
MTGFHHVEVWIADRTGDAAWEWLLSSLGFVREQEWSEGMSWAAGGAYLTLTTSPNLSASEHDRRRPGVNHLAFHGGSTTQVDALMAAAPAQGWHPLYTDRYPYAGGEDHYAGWLENAAGFKVEVVAER